MSGLPNLDELGQQLRRVDQHLVNLLAQRMSIARKVEEFKRANDQPILRQEIEKKRLDQYAEWAGELNLSSDFARAIMYQVISESCRVQLDQQQKRSPLPVFPEDIEEYNRLLKANLTKLTEKWAPAYDDRYTKPYPATRMYFRFEGALLDQEIAQLENKDLALDLGCATGRRTRRLARKFQRAIGYDLSPAMIALAQQKGKEENSGDVCYIVTDLEAGIPQRDNSTSFVLMSLGTASDVQNIKLVLDEIQRVLMPNGRFLLSFYNAGALIYRWRFLPWPLPLAAEINLTRHCLDVHCEGEIFSVYAHPYTTQEVREFLPRDLRASQVFTYPTISSILPHDIFDSDEIAKSMAEIEENLASLTGGAYILVTGTKQ